jgi:hypothetical protein
LGRIVFRAGAGQVRVRARRSRRFSRFKFRVHGHPLPCRAAWAAWIRKSGRPLTRGRIPRITGLSGVAFIVLTFGQIAWETAFLDPVA